MTYTEILCKTVKAHVKVDILISRRKQEGCVCSVHWVPIDVTLGQVPTFPTQKADAKTFLTRLL